MLTMICNISMYFYSELFDHLFEVSSDFKTPCQVIKFDPDVIRIGWFQKRFMPHPQQKFLPLIDGEGDLLKNVFNLYRCLEKGRGYCTFPP